MANVYGRWRLPTGRLCIIEAINSYKIRGTWRGDKGGHAGFEARLPSGGASGGVSVSARGVWHDEDAGVYDRDGLALELEYSTTEADKLTLKLHTKAGDTRVLSVARDVVPRDAGRIKEFACRDRSAFQRIADDSAEARKAKAEETRRALLEASLKETAELRPGDGVTTYIPPLAVCDAFDDSVQRKHGQHSRHCGKQMLSSGVIQPPASVPWLPDPYEDSHARFKRQRRARSAHLARTVPARLLEREAFRPTNKTGSQALAGTALEVYLGVVDHDVPEKTLKELGTRALASAAPVDDKTPAANHQTHLERTAEGRLAVKFDPRNLVAGYPHWTEAANKPLEYVAEDFEAKRAAQRKAFLDAQAKLAGKPAFRPVGPAIVHAATEHPEPAPAVPHSPSPKASEPGSPVGGAAARPASAHARSTVKRGEGASERPPYNPFTKDITRFERSVGKFPEYVLPPIDAAGDGARSPARSRPGSARSIPASSSDVKRPGTADRPGWHEVMSPATKSRAIAPVVTHTLNILQRVRGSAATASAGQL